LWSSSTLPFIGRSRVAPPPPVRPIAYPDLIAYPLQHLLFIFNWSWSSHTFSSCWKPTTIIPIHKPADSPASYRPISLTFCISKLFERWVLKRLCYYLESKYLISPTQATFDLVGLPLIKFFCCPKLFGTAFKRKDFQIKLFWPPLIFLKLLIRSGTRLSFINY